MGATGKSGPITDRTALALKVESVIARPNLLSANRQSWCRSPAQVSVGIVSYSQAITGTVGQTSPSAVRCGGENEKNMQSSPSWVARRWIASTSLAGSVTVMTRPSP